MCSCCRRTRALRSAALRQACPSRRAGRAVRPVPIRRPKPSPGSRGPHARSHSRRRRAALPACDTPSPIAEQSTFNRRSITAPDVDTTYTATFDTQYLLTAMSRPDRGGLPVRRRLLHCRHGRYGQQRRECRIHVHELDGVLGECKLPGDDDRAQGRHREFPDHHLSPYRHGEPSQRRSGHQHRKSCLHVRVDLLDKQRRRRDARPARHGERGLHLRFLGRL